MDFSGAYRVYRIWGGGALLVFTERYAHQIWLASCVADGEMMVDKGGELWIPMEV